MAIAVGGGSVAEWSGAADGGDGVCSRGRCRDVGAVAAGGISFALGGWIAGGFVAIVSRARLWDSRRVCAGCDGEEWEWTGGVGFVVCIVVRIGALRRLVFRDAGAGDGDSSVGSHRAI